MKKRILAMLLALVTFCALLPMPARAAELPKYSDLLLDINWDHIKTVGKQPRSGPCGCFALAYARTLLDGKVHQWTEFRASASSDSVTFSKGDYKTLNPGTKAAAFKYLYEQLCSGNPAIVFVRKKGQTSNTHFVTVVGFQNVTDLDSLSEKNFLILDPAQNPDKYYNLSSKYELRTSTKDDKYRVYVDTTSKTVKFAAKPYLLAVEQEYLSKCTWYPSHQLAVVKADSTYIKKLPCSEKTNSASTNVTKLEKGAEMTVVGLYKNSAGNYWYQVLLEDGKTGFAYCADVQGIACYTNSVLIAAELATTTPKKGAGCKISGSVSSDYLKITSVTGVLKDSKGKTQTVTIKEGFSDLSQTDINKKLAFGKLSAGEGTLTISVEGVCYTSEDGKTLTSGVWGNRAILNFTVKDVFTVTYNANGGSGAPAAVEVKEDDEFTISTKVPTREGYQFVGWYDSREVDDKGEPLGKKYDGKTTITGNLTLYAIWKEKAHEHSYVSKITEPTCTEKGYTTHTCTCGDSYTDSETAALGHKWNAGTVTREPTEAAEGEKTFVCTACKATKTESIAKLDHVHKHTAKVTAPTCTEKGYTTHTCTCGDSYTDSETAALGHNWDDGEITREPREDPGERTYTCTVCGGTETEEIPSQPSVTEPPAASILWGDVNGDGWVDSYDAALILKYDVMLIGDSDLDLTAADVSGDGWVDSYDASLILKYDVMLIDKFPAER